MRGRRPGGRIGILVCALALLCGGFAPAGAAEKAGERVVGGQLAPAGAYPWMVSFVEKGKPNDFQGHHCGGSLVREQWVLTAAHCFFDPLTGMPESLATKEVVLGKTKLTGPGGERRDLTRVIIHEAYQGRAYDLALAELSAPVPAGILALAGVGEESRWAPGRMVRIIGWGTTTEGGTRSDDLLHADVPIVSDAECSSSYPGTPLEHRFFAGIMLCAGYQAGGVDTCQGDSGGPLVSWDPALGWRQVGVVNWGTGCARPNKPGVYARIGADPLRTWISQRLPRLALPADAVAPSPPPPLLGTPAPGTPPPAAAEPLTETSRPTATKKRKKKKASCKPRKSKKRAGRARSCKRKGQKKQRSRR